MQQSYSRIYFLCKVEDNSTCSDHKTLDSVLHANKDLDGTRDLRKIETKEHVCLLLRNRMVHFQCRVILCWVLLD